MRGLEGVLVCFSLMIWFGAFIVGGQGFVGVEEKSLTGSSNSVLSVPWTAVPGVGNTVLLCISSTVGPGTYSVEAPANFVLVASQLWNSGQAGFQGCWSLRIDAPLPVGVSFSTSVRPTGTGPFVALLVEYSGLGAVDVVELGRSTDVTSTVDSGQDVTSCTNERVIGFVSSTGTVTLDQPRQMQRTPSGLNVLGDFAVGPAVTFVSISGVSTSRFWGALMMVFRQSNSDCSAAAVHPCCSGFFPIDSSSCSVEGICRVGANVAALANPTRPFLAPSSRVLPPGSTDPLVQFSAPQVALSGELNVTIFQEPKNNQQYVLMTGTFTGAFSIIRVSFAGNSTTRALLTNPVCIQTTAQQSSSAVSVIAFIRCPTPFWIPIVAAVCGVIGLLLVVLIVYLCFRRKRYSMSLEGIDDLDRRSAKELAQPLMSKKKHRLAVPSAGDLVTRDSAMPQTTTTVLSDDEDLEAPIQGNLFSYVEGGTLGGGGRFESVLSSSYFFEGRRDDSRLE